jgi:hypothetical protein
MTAPSPVITMLTLLDEADRKQLDEVKTFELWAVCEGFDVTRFTSPSVDDDPAMEGRRWQSTVTTRLWWAWSAGVQYGRITP